MQDYFQPTSSKVYSWSFYNNAVKYYMTFSNIYKSTSWWLLSEAETKWKVTLQQKGFAFTIYGTLKTFHYRKRVPLFKDLFMSNDCLSFVNYKGVVGKFFIWCSVWTLCTLVRCFGANLFTGTRPSCGIFYSKIKRC